MGYLGKIAVGSRSDLVQQVTGVSGSGWSWRWKRTLRSGQHTFQILVTWM
jgi:hypothetical protein